MVGSGTIEADDPQLTTRATSENGRDAARVVVSGDATISPDCRVLKLESSAPTLVAVKTDAPEERKSALSNTGAELIEVEPKNGKIDLNKLAQELGARDIASIMIEGGGGLLAAAFDAGIIDKALFFIAPKIVGGEQAPTPVEGSGVETVDEAVRLENLSVHRYGEDVLIEGYVVK